MLSIILVQPMPATITATLQILPVRPPPEVMPPPPPSVSATSEAHYLFQRPLSLPVRPVMPVSAPAAGPVFSTAAPLPPPVSQAMPADPLPPPLRPAVPVPFPPPSLPPSVRPPMPVSGPVPVPAQFRPPVRPAMSVSEPPAPPVAEPVSVDLGPSGVERPLPVGRVASSWSASASSSWRDEGSENEEVQIDDEGGRDGDDENGWHYRHTWSVRRRTTSTDVTTGASAGHSHWPRRRPMDHSDSGDMCAKRPRIWSNGHWET